MQPFICRAENNYNTVIFSQIFKPGQLSSLFEFNKTPGMKMEASNTRRIQPISGQYPGHIITFSQSEASIQDAICDASLCCDQWDVTLLPCCETLHGWDWSRDLILASDWLLGRPDPSQNIHTCKNKNTATGKYFTSQMKINGAKNWHFKQRLWLIFFGPLRNQVFLLVEIRQFFPEFSVKYSPPQFYNK